MPIVILITMEALRAVPRASARPPTAWAPRAGRSSGRTCSRTPRPASSPGAILSLARAFGETAPLLLVGAVTGYFSSAPGRTPLEVLQGPYTALPTQIFSWAKLPAKIGKRTRRPPSSCLLVAILVVNFLAILLRNRYERTW